MIYLVSSCDFFLGQATRRKKIITVGNVIQSSKPVFLLHATLMIPNVVVRPSLEEVQEALVTAGRSITSVAKGVAQWTGGKNQKVGF